MAKVLTGKDGYLFLKEDSNSIIDQHTGKFVFDKPRLKRWENVIRDRLQKTKHLNCQYYFQILPDNHSIYSQFLPDELKLAEKKNANIFLDYFLPILEQRISFPLDELRQHSIEEQVCHKTDTHCTDRGICVAYCHLVALIQKDFPEIQICKNIEYEIKSHHGDLARMLGQNEKTNSEFLIAPASVEVVFNNEVVNTGRIEITINHNVDNELVVVLFGGSSCLSVKLFLSLSFKKVVFCWSANCDDLILNSIKPDIVISQVRERFLIMPANDIEGISPTEMAFVKSFITSPERTICPLEVDMEELLLNCLGKLRTNSNETYKENMQSISRELGLLHLYNKILDLNLKKIPYNRIKKSIRKEYDLLVKRIKKSKLFSADYVANQLESINIRPESKRLSAQYLLHGHRFEYRSSDEFNGKHYWQAYPAVEASGIHPLFHYETRGKQAKNQIYP